MEVRLPDFAINRKGNVGETLPSNEFDIDIGFQNGEPFIASYADMLECPKNIPHRSINA